jgi:hypothetical protein
MYTISQKMKMYYVDFNFPSKDHAICNYDHMWFVQHN